MPLRVGDPAPPFRGRTHDGKSVSLDEFRGRYLVLYFYPKASTRGCTLEAKRFRDHYSEIRELGAEVVGVSVDGQDAQCEFATRNELSFPLVADADKAVSRSYGVLRRLLPVARRVTYVVDPEGKVAARFEHELQVGRHLDDVIGFLQSVGDARPS